MLLLVKTEGGMYVCIPGVYLVCHHDMLRCVLDHAPQGALHSAVDAALVFRLCLLALTSFS